jgi:hypothetical protein
MDHLRKKYICSWLVAYILCATIVFALPENTTIYCCMIAWMILGGQLLLIAYRKQRRLLDYVKESHYEHWLKMNWEYGSLSKFFKDNQNFGDPKVMPLKNNYLKAYKFFWGAGLLSLVSLWTAAAIKLN